MARVSEPAGSAAGCPGPDLIAPSELLARPSRSGAVAPARSSCGLAAPRRPTAVPHWLAVQTLDSPAPDLGDRSGSPHLTAAPRDDLRPQLGFDARRRCRRRRSDGSCTRCWQLMDGRYRLGESATSRSARCPTDRRRTRLVAAVAAHRIAAAAIDRGAEAAHRPARRPGTGRTRSASSSSGRASAPRRGPARPRVTVVRLGARTRPGRSRPTTGPPRRSRRGLTIVLARPPRDRSGHHHGTDPADHPHLVVRPRGPGCGGGPARRARAGPLPARAPIWPGRDADPDWPRMLAQLVPTRGDCGRAGRRLGGRSGRRRRSCPTWPGVRLETASATIELGPRRRDPGSGASGRSHPACGCCWSPHAEWCDRPTDAAQRRSRPRSAPPDERHRRPAGAVQPAARGPAGRRCRSGSPAGPRSGSASGSAAPGRAGDAELQQRAAEQLFRVLGELKGGAMKFGQALSLFEAVLPEEIAGAVPRAPDPAAGRRTADADVAGARGAGRELGAGLAGPIRRLRPAAGGRGLHRPGAPGGLARRSVGGGEGAVSGRRRGAAVRPAADRPAVAR